MGKEPARDARGGERESNCGACFGLADGVDMSGATTLVMSVG